MIIIHLMQFFMGIFILILVYKIWQCHNQLGNIIKEGNELLQLIEVHERKLNLMIYTFECRIQSCKTPEK